MTALRRSMDIYNRKKLWRKLWVQCFIVLLFALGGVGLVFIEYRTVAFFSFLVAIMAFAGCVCTVSDIISTDIVKKH